MLVSITNQQCLLNTEAKSGRPHLPDTIKSVEAKLMAILHRVNHPCTAEDQSVLRTLQLSDLHGEEWRRAQPLESDCVRSEHGPVSY